MMEPSQEQLIIEPGEPPKILTILNLIDGRASMGLPLNSLRGYINMGGIVPLQFLRSLPSGANNYQQIPIGLEEAQTNSHGLWQAMEQRLSALKAFLTSLESTPLSQAPGGAEYLRDPPQLVERGKIIFARHCAQCHSSKHPDPSITDPEQLRLAYEELVLSPDFLEDNFLSDDWRYPITEIQTNAARALVPNTTEGHIFEEFSSESYKQLPSAGTLEGLFNPLRPWNRISFDLPAGGRGYYRTPSLISMWATAPYLHNDSLGRPNQDPSVGGRMEAFYEGVWKLLWPKARQGIRSIKRTQTASVLTDSLGNPVMVPRPQGNASPLIVPARTPVNLFANLHPLDLREVVAAYAQSGIRAALFKALELNRGPDFIEDRGHYYGTDLSNWDKWALITFLKRL
ncbi:hypothetical protein [Nitrosococcus wardiae]|nr:hypothetical protein [Nitrosococcus wardiae]